MKKCILLIMIGLSMGIIVACGSENKSVLSDKELSQNYCEGCHGDDIKGRGLSKSAILKAINKGVPGMDADILKGEDADRVAKYWSDKQ
jgi:cytochrome c551